MKRTGITHFNFSRDIYNEYYEGKENLEATTEKLMRIVNSSMYCLTRKTPIRKHKDAILRNGINSINVASVKSAYFDMWSMIYQILTPKHISDTFDLEDQRLIKIRSDILLYILNNV